MTTKFTVIIEVSAEDVNANTLHEALCLAIHEGDTEVLQSLTNTISDIYVPTKVTEMPVVVRAHLLDGNDENDLVTLVWQSMNDLERGELIAEVEDLERDL